MSRLRSLLATLRIANAPSVVSNVLLGVVVGGMLALASRGNADLHQISWRAVCLPAAAGLLLYFAGNLANDWFDQDWDRERRPERALPSGLFGSGTYLAASIVSAMLGTAVAFTIGAPSGIAALFILSFIILYTWIHKRTAWSVIPMGMCRAGLYLLGFTSWWSWEKMGLLLKGMEGAAALLMLFGGVAVLCFGLVAYIAGLSMSARYEGMADAPTGPKVIARALLMVPLIAMPCWILPLAPTYGWIGMIPFSLWLAVCLTRYRRPIPVFVSALLAGIPLVDGILLLPVGWSIWSEKASSHSLGIAVAAVPVIAFVLGRALQKLAPAT